LTAAPQPRSYARESSKLDAVLALVEPDMQRVNQIIVARLDSPISLIPELAGHLVAAGGKRVRPMLTLLAAKLCGYDGARHVKLAAAVEFIHTATLLHDDVVDESELRRGLATANAIWGNKPPVLVGDFLFARAFQLMVEDGSLAVLGILANASAVIAEGEVAQLMTANDTATTEDQYLSVIAAKTATLFAAAAEIGGVVADRPEAEAAALRTYGAGHRLPAGRRRARLQRPRGGPGQERGRRLSRRQDHPAGGPRLPERQPRGAALLAAHPGAGRAARG
jgi:octaprenyl-diphosphate synthase